ncbi:MAG: glycerol-3-phosphate dehydrogenase/oxidase [Candidatus Omnitrophica bacterium]|nr:glycerol-3-phosphate dehydrogenase/oxidase [Candidatus Omnitrophota bacterium]
MKRDLGMLSTQSYDVIIIGGGIYGACAAWEAALRGLSVALVERGDFGHATSANSQKIIHGGLRYLQHGNLKRMRESIRERRILMRVAPHLVHPLPFLMPTYGWGLRSRVTMRTALTVYDLVACDRNSGMRDPQKQIPQGRIVSREECLRLAPGIPDEGLTGGALWHDGQVYNSERLTLSFVLSAARAGAAVANYVEVTGFLRNHSRISGVTARDVLTGEPLEISAKVVLNTSGPWVGRVLRSLNGHRPLRSPGLVKAMNLVTRPLAPKVAVGLQSPARSGKAQGLLFITPWQDCSVIGTTYTAYDGDPMHGEMTEEEIQAFIEEVNQSYPAAGLHRSDVQRVHVGLLPAAANQPAVAETAYRLLDHERLHGVAGLVSVLGVKYTTARDVAEKATDLVCEKLGCVATPGRSRTTPVVGADFERFDAFLDEALRERCCDLDASAIRRLVYTYGSTYREVLRLVRENPAWAELVASTPPVIKAEIIYAVRQELALTLNDVVFRRTGLGAAGHPGTVALRTCAELMAWELGWEPARMERELADTEAAFARIGARSEDAVEVRA